MSVGTAVTKKELDAAITGIGTDIHLAMKRATDFKYYLDGVLDADLTALTYSAEDIANLRTAVADIDQLSTVFRGAAALAVAKDFRTFLRRVWGFGVDRWT